MQAQREQYVSSEETTRGALFREVNENIAALCGEWNTTGAAAAKARAWDPRRHG